MTELERKAHLLRRFSFGAGRCELDRFPTTSAATLAKLLSEDKTPDSFTISPWQFSAQADGKLDTNSYHMGPWWALRMVMTQCPLTEKLTLFWHDHFAIEAEKVGEAPTMASYLEVLRTKGRGKFRDLLKAVMTQGAMLWYLDGHISHKTKPNENLAREIFELFTMGEGSGYTETDIRELSRAITGWSLHYMGSYMEMPYDKVKERADGARMAINNVCYVPALHDDGTKTILGKSQRFTWDEALDHIASHPQTARYIATKLWSFYAYPDPEPAVIERLMKVWKQTDGEIKAILKAIAEAPEFWSEKCVRSMPKSPADWVVGNLRNLDLAPILYALHKKPEKDITPVVKELRDAANTAYYLMSQQGLQLLFPPDVSGWKWGEGWLSADTSAKRIRSGDAIYWGGGDARPISVHTANLLKTKFAVTDVPTLVDAYLALVDAEVTPEQKALMVERCTKAGGMGALAKPNSAAGLFSTLSRLVCAVPAYQLA